MFLLAESWKHLLDNLLKPEGLSAKQGVWAEVEEQLPPGWRLDGLRCASTGLTPEERSEECGGCGHRSWG